MNSIFKKFGFTENNGIYSNSFCEITIPKDQPKNSPVTKIMVNGETDSFVYDTDLEDILVSIILHNNLKVAGYDFIGKQGEIYNFTNGLSYKIEEDYEDTPKLYVMLNGVEHTLTDYWNSYKNILQLLK